MLDECIYGRKLRETPLVAPLIEISAGRSGSTQIARYLEEDERLVAELDGRLFHDNAQQRDRDLDRDLDDAADGHVVVRLGWGQVTRRACRTARRLATLLATRGWTGAMSACPDCQ